MKRRVKIVFIEWKNEIKLKNTLKWIKWCVCVFFYWNCSDDENIVWLKLDWKKEYKNKYDDHEHHYNWTHMSEIDLSGQCLSRASFPYQLIFCFYVIIAFTSNIYCSPLSLSLSVPHAHTLRMCNVKIIQM